MKKIAKYLFFVLSGLILGSCTEDFKDWASPQSYAQEDAITIPGFTASAVPTIDLNTYEGTEVELFTTNTSNLPDGYSVSTYTLEMIPENYETGEISLIEFFPDGNTMTVPDLQVMIVDCFGARPVERTFSTHVYATVDNGEGAVKVDCGTINIVAIPKAPEIEDTYYITGGINGWDNTNTTYKLTNGGGDVYDDPEFSITISAEDAGEGFEFKLTPESGLGGDWSKCISATEDNAEGKFAYNNVGGNLSMTTSGALYYNLTFNMLEMTWSVTPLYYDEVYYITGGINGWDNTNTEYEVSNGFVDVSSNSVFSVVLDAETVGEGFEFKLTPKSGLGGDWSKCISATEDNAEGKFAFNNVGGNLKVDAVEGAKLYRLEFNVMDQTWSVKALNFGEYYYEIGNESGWATSHPLYGGNFDGKYRGFYYLNGEFKFKPNADNWEGDLEYVSDGVLTESGGPNVPDPGAGFYMIDLDAAALTYALTKVESIGIIGGFNSWGSDEEMTYNVEGGYWEATITFAEDTEYKFRMNHDWSVNWGGSLSNLEHNGDNLKAEAGTYNIKLYLGYAGTFKAEVTKQ